MSKVVAGMAVLLVCSMAHGKEKQALRQWIEIKGGVNAFLNGQSNAIPHRVKPVARIEWVRNYWQDLGFGVELVGVIDGNSGYRFIAAFANAHASLYGGDVFRLLLMGGWGIGTGPPILFTDVSVEASVMVHAHAGLEMRWQVVNELLDLGVDLVSEDLSMVALSAALSFRF